MKVIGYVKPGTPKIELPIQPGDTVIVPKGLIIRSCHPTRDSVVNRKNLTVEVKVVFSGYTAEEHGEKKEHHPFFYWAGSGGYWRWVDIKDVVILKKNGKTVPDQAPN